jgi:DNA-binding NtrC family response regulator
MGLQAMEARAKEGSMRGRALIVEDDRSMCDLLEESLGQRGFQATAKTSAEEGFLSLETDDYDVVVTDLNLRGMNGIELCERITANRPDVPVIVITAFGSLETAVAAIRAGAYDFIVKPFEIDELIMTLDRAVQYHSLREEVKRLRQEVAGAQPFQEFIGESAPMKRLYDMIARVAESEASVLLCGETGTGKELVARALHRRSRRASGPFVAINCAAMPEALLESELFGHTRGAFTDAKAPRTGLFVRASGGTLFLDEIGDMPLGLQPKLLRALQERRIRPVGGDFEVEFDARLIAASNRDLETAVEKESFREDLYFRINVIQIDVPPLMARGNDVLLLAQHFIERFAVQAGKRVKGLTGPAAEKLLSYSWPGNIRELQNSMERAVALTTFEEVTVEDLPEKVRNYSRSHVLLASDNPEELLPMDEVERRYILRVLEAVGGNKTLAARILGFDRRTLYRKLESKAFRRRLEES